MASTTSFERKGLMFGMESSPASAEVKGSRQAEEKRETKRERDKREWRGRRWASESDKRRRACRTGHQKTKSRKTDVGWGSRGEAARYLPTLSPLEAPLSRTAWRAGRLTAGRRDHSPSSLHCRQNKIKYEFILLQVKNR